MSFKMLSIKIFLNYSTQMGIACFKVDEENVRPAQDESFFDLKANDISGRRVDFYVYKNRKAFLLVNVATKSIGAKQYFKMLNEIYSQYGEHGLQILAFPCSQFTSREPKSNDEIRAVLQKNYDIRFSLFEKIDVNGLNTHPVYKYLRNQPLLLNQATGKSKTIPENFTICLLNKDGKLIQSFKPSKDYEEMKRLIKRILAQQKLMTKRGSQSTNTVKSVSAVN